MKNDSGVSFNVRVCFAERSETFLSLLSVLLRQEVLSRSHTHRFSHTLTPAHTLLTLLTVPPELLGLSAEVFL